MSLKAFLSGRVTAHLTSRERLERNRARAEAARQAAGEAHVVHYFHQADDPYSHLAAQVLHTLDDRYDIELKIHLVPAPPDWAAPDRARLIQHSRIDAARLAGKAGLSFADPGAQPPAEAVAQAERALQESLNAWRFSEEAPAIGEALWRGEDALAGFPMSSPDEVKAALSASDELRAREGHYLGATFYYGGEWYWGIDRLHYLEERLTELGLNAKGGTPPIFAPPALALSPPPDTPKGKELHFYYSFRSPYTYIALERVFALAKAYEADLKLRFILPMVMRGLPVPSAKRGYITADVAREARRIGVPFGRIVDPLGKPVERGYALMPWAIAQGKGEAYSLAFMRGVWAEGIDAGSDGGLRKIVTNAGLDWSEARKLIGNEDWRPEAEANRKELLDIGLWGAPTYRVGNVSTWGQDRLWVIEEALSDRAGGPSETVSSAS